MRQGLAAVAVTTFALLVPQVPAEAQSPGGVTVDALPAYAEESSRAPGNPPGEARFLIRREAGASPLPTVVEYETVPGDARPGSDYESRAGRLVLTPLQPGATVTVPLLDDAVREQDEQMLLRVRPLLGSEQLVPMTILDEDPRRFDVWGVSVPQPDCGTDCGIAFFGVGAHGDAIDDVWVASGELPDFRVVENRAAPDSDDSASGPTWVVRVSFRCDTPQREAVVQIRERRFYGAGAAADCDGTPSPPGGGPPPPPPPGGSTLPPPVPLPFLPIGPGAPGPSPSATGR